VFVRRGRSEPPGRDCCRWYSCWLAWCRCGSRLVSDPGRTGSLAEELTVAPRPGISPRLVHHQRCDAAVPPSSHPRHPTGRRAIHHARPGHSHSGIPDCEHRARRGLPAPRLLRSSYRPERSWSGDSWRGDEAELAKSVKFLLRWKSTCSLLRRVPSRGNRRLVTLTLHCVSSGD
jgi:hypothetical protein